MYTNRYGGFHQTSQAAGGGQARSPGGQRLAQFFKALHVLLLVALFSALLPVRSASADDQRVTISADTVDGAALAAFWTRLKRENSRESARQMEAIVLDEYMIITPPSPKLSQALAELKRKYRAAIGYDQPPGSKADTLSNQQLLHILLDTASGIPALQPKFKDVWEEIKNPNRFVGDQPTIQLAANASNYSLDRHLRLVYEQQLRTLKRKAREQPPVAQLYDEFFKADLGVGINEFNAKAFYEEHPYLAPPNLRENIQPDGSVTLSLNELRTMARGEFDKINNSIDDMQDTLVDITAQQASLVEFMEDQQARQEAEEQAEEAARAYQEKIQAAESGIYVISTLIGFIDEDAGHQVEVVASSLLQIGDALSGWSKAIAGLNTLEALTSLSTVVMTGNVLGAVMNIVSLFGSSGPTPEQMILEEIGKLREQVNELRVEMHERFDRIDETLNEIYSTMQDRFDKLDLELGKINGNLAEIQKTLVGLDLRLSRMERNSFEFLDAVGRRPLLNAINGAIGYKERTGLDMPYQPQFVTFENDFHTWGTINAYDALSAGPTQRDYRDSQVLAELEAYPLDANLNYLNGWLLAHGMPPFANKRLPGSRDWLYASRAYAQLGMDWPEHLRRIDPQRQASLDAVGNELERAMQTIGTMTVRSSTGVTDTETLYTRIVDYYSTKFDQLNTSLVSTERRYVNDVRTDLDRPVAFNLFGGLDQTLAYTATDFIAMTCSDTSANDLPTPANLKNLLPGYNRYTLAEYLRVSEITVCLEGRWINEYEVCREGPGGGEICEPYGTPQAYLTLEIDDVEMAARFVNGQRAVKILSPSSISQIAAIWGSYYKPAFEAQFAAPLALASQPPAAQAQYAATSEALTAALVNYQRAFYGRVLGGLNGQNTDNLRPDSIELGGAKKLLESFVALGLPHAAGNDDFLRSLLYSNQSLVDDQQVVAAYAAGLSGLQAITAQADEVDLTRNPRVVVMTAGSKRYEAIDDLLAQYTDAIADETYTPTIDLVVHARQDMRLAQRIAGIDVPDPDPAPSDYTVFLPLMRR